MRQSYFGHDEFAKFAPGMKSIADVLTIRRRVFGAFEMAETSDDPADLSASGVSDVHSHAARNASRYGYGR